MVHWKGQTSNSRQAVRVGVAANRKNKMVRPGGESSNSLGRSNLIPDEALFDELIAWNEVLSQTEFYSKAKKPPPKRRKGGCELDLS